MSKLEKYLLSIDKSSVKAVIQEYGTPLYLYDLDVITSCVENIKTNVDYRPLNLHFACMANNNVFLLREIGSLGLKIFVCSPGELHIAQAAGFEPNEIIMTGSNFSEHEIDIFAKSGIQINADSIHQLRQYASKGVRSLGLRISPDVELPGETINAAVGPRSRLGILENRLEEAFNLAKDHDVKIVGVHMYVGTNILEYKHYREPINHLIEIAKEIKDIKYVDIGGGFGIAYKEYDRNFEWKPFGEFISDKMNELSAVHDREIELNLEPGRSVIASAGMLVARVIEVKQNNGFTFIGTDTSLSNFARPYIYNQNHEVFLISDKKSRKNIPSVYICGNTVASSDYLAKDIYFPKTNEGDLIAIMDVGAYGFSMSSHFCCRLKPAEVLLKEGKVKLIRERETVDDLLYKQVDTK